jgi:hypothetical protein
MTFDFEYKGPAQVFREDGEDMFEFLAGRDLIERCDERARSRVVDLMVGNPSLAEQVRDGLLATRVATLCQVATSGIGDLAQGEVDQQTPKVVARPRCSVLPGRCGEEAGEEALQHVVGLNTAAQARVEASGYDRAEP